ncbi:MAG TPA: hypothetical protein VIT02_13260 [Burkholderiaceae bacterium]
MQLDGLVLRQHAVHAVERIAAAIELGKRIGTPPLPHQRAHQPAVRRFRARIDLEPSLEHFHQALVLAALLVVRGQPLANGQGHALEPHALAGVPGVELVTGVVEQHTQRAPVQRQCPGQFDALAALRERLELHDVDAHLRRLEHQMRRGSEDRNITTAQIAEQLPQTLACARGVGVGPQQRAGPVARHAFGARLRDQREQRDRAPREITTRDALRGAQRDVAEKLQMEHRPIIDDQRQALAVFFAPGVGGVVTAGGVVDTDVNLGAGFTCEVRVGNPSFAPRSVRALERPRSS